MDYETRVPYTGDPARVLRSLVLTFSNLGFRVEGKGDRRVELSGVPMHNSRESPLVGISRVVLTVEGGELRAAADFGSARRLIRFTSWFVAGLAVFLTALFAVIFREREGFRLWIVILPFVPWPFLLPVLHRLLIARTRRALDNLLYNASVVSG